MNEMIMVSHSLSNNSCTDLVISGSLFKYKSFDQSDPPPRMASNFRHLLSCGTIIWVKKAKYMKNS